MTQYKRVGIDTSKAVFTLHGIDQQEGDDSGRELLEKGGHLRAAEVEP